MTRTILLVHEHPHVVSTLKAGISPAGYIVRTAQTFDEAMTLLRQCEPDAVVTAVELGAFNGLHLLMHAKAQHPSAKVIVLGPPSRAIEEEARALGAATYIRRPFSADGIVDVLNTYFFSPLRVFTPAHQSVAGLR